MLAAMEQKLFNVLAPSEDAVREVPFTKTHGSRGGPIDLKDAPPPPPPAPPPPGMEFSDSRPGSACQLINSFQLFHCFFFILLSAVHVKVPVPKQPSRWAGFACEWVSPWAFFDKGFVLNKTSTPIASLENSFVKERVATLRQQMTVLSEQIAAARRQISVLVTVKETASFFLNSVHLCAR